MTDQRRFSRRRFLGVAATAGATLLAPRWAGAQAAYPSRPIKLIVPYAAGGGTDFFARLAGQTMGATLGQQIVVENRPGAGTQIGAEAVARAEPDGYTFLLGDTSTFASNRSLYQRLPYDVDADFAPVTLTGRFAIVLLVNTSKLAVSSVGGLIEMAKKSPEAINYGSAGVGSPFHLAAELLAQGAKIKMTHVPYKGAGPALQDLAAGQIGMMFVDFATARAQLSNPSIKAIAVCSPGEFYGLPGVAPVSKDVPGFEAWAWQGFVVPAKAPPAAVTALRDAYLKAVGQQDIKDKLVAAGIDPLQSTPEEMRAYIRSETEKWRSVVTTAGIKLD